MFDSLKTEDAGECAAKVVGSLRAAPAGRSGPDRQMFAFAFVILLVLSVFVSLLTMGYADVTEDGRRDLRNLSDVIATNVEDALRRADGTLGAVSSLLLPSDFAGDPGSVRRDDFNTVLAEQLRQFPEVSNLYVFDGQGGTLFRAGVASTQFDVGGTRWFQRLHDDPQQDLILSDVETNRTTGQASMVMARAVRTRGGKWLGVAAAWINLEHFQRSIDRISMLEHGRITLERADTGRLLLSNPEQPAAINQINLTELESRAIAGDQTGMGRYVVDGEERMYAFRCLSGYPVVVGVSEASSDLLEEWLHEAGLVFLLVLAVVGALITLFLRQRSSQKILHDANEALRFSETLLTESEERFRMTFEQAAVGIIHNGFDRSLLRFNRRFCEILGYDPDEMVGQSYLRFTHAEDVGLSDEAVAPLLRGEKASVTWEKRYVRKSGEVIWVRLTSSLQRSVEGYPLHFITVIEDVTLRKSMEERLTSEAMRYEGLLRTASDGIHVVDEEGNLVEASDSFFRMLGYQPQDGQKLNIRDWDVGAAGAQVQEALRKHMSEVSSVFETRHRRRDGTVFDVEIHARKLMLEGRRYLYASSRDVSGRKQADAARERAELDLRATSARMRLVLDTSAEGIVGMDDESRIIFANRAAAEMLCWDSPDAMLIRPSSEILGHRVADGRSCIEAGCAIRNTLADGQTRRVSDEVFCGPNGILRPVEYVAAPLLVESIAVGVVVAFHDISERKAMESELIRSNAELEQFAYVVSHDLRQPLRMISSYLGLIERQLASTIDAETKTFFEFATGGARRMDRLIVDLLEYSRVGRQKSGLTPLDLNEIVADGVQNLTVAITEANATVHVAEHFPCVKGHRSELVRLFQNLVGNAVKYRFADRPSKVEVGFRPQGREWVLWVRDNGIGIDPKDFDRAFGVFQRLVAGDRYEGTGIGLAVCKKIVERHGGRIWIESEPGKGAAFLFTLPKAG